MGMFLPPPRKEILASDRKVTSIILSKSSVSEVGGLSVLPKSAEPDIGPVVLSNFRRLRDLVFFFNPSEPSERESTLRGRSED